MIANTVLLQWSFMGSSVIIIIFAIRWMIKAQVRKTWQYALWLIVMIRLLMPVLPTSPYSLFNFMQEADKDEQIAKSGQIAKGEQIPQSEKIINIEQDSYGIQEPTIEITHINTIKNQTEKETVETNLLESSKQYILSFWGIGVFSILAYFTWIYCRLSKYTKQLQLWEDLETLSAAEKIKEKLKIKRNIRLLKGDRPMLSGIIRPLIVFPEGYQEKEIEAMLMHELIHYKYKDNWIAYLQVIAIALHWFNPLVWLAMYYMRRDMEFACDERVIAKGQDKKHYVNTLLKVTTNASCPPYLAYSMGENTNHVKQRIMQIVNFKKPKFWMSLLVVMLLIVLPYICLTNPSTRIDAKASLNIGSMFAKEETEINRLSEVNQGVKNILFFGQEPSGERMDVIMLVNLDTQTGNMNVTSIPRDTKVIWGEGPKRLLTEEIKAPEMISKINEMSAYTGARNIREVTVAQIEDMLNIKIDNYIVIQINDLIKIVDAVGGVPIDVPMRMRYTDSSQGLNININEGYARLDGEQVQQFIRFRQMRNGDLDRIGNQQLFLKAFIEEILKTNQIENLFKLAPSVLSNLKTDISLDDLIYYFKGVTQIKVENMTHTILPGEASYEGGFSYFIIDEEATRILIKKQSKK